MWRSVVAVVVLAAVAIPAGAEERVALVVGNADYPKEGRFAPLANPVHDADDVAAVLREYGFQVQPVLHDADEREMDRAVEQFVASLSRQPGSVGLFYYSGHGVQVGEHNYLIPVGRRFADTSDVKYHALNANALLDKMVKYGTRAGIMILDSCRSLWREGKGGERKGLGEMSARGAIISYASALGQEALGQRGQRNSLYTAHLLTAMREEAGQPIGEVFDRARELVATDPRLDRNDPQQIPWTSSGLLGRFCFGECRAAGEDPEKVALARENERLREELARRGGGVPVSPAAPEGGAGWRTGQVFRDRLQDGSQGPEMVEVEGGRFRMGCGEGDPGCEDDEKPAHEVTVPPFAIGRYEVTFDEYDRFAEATGREKPGDRGWGRGRRPAINVSREDAAAYARWLSQQSGQTYRLPREAEWEYAARAGTTTPYSTGACLSTDQANYNGNWPLDGCPKSGVDREKTLPVDELPPNPWGLYHIHGNALEWVEDCYHNSYQGAPADGSAWQAGSCTKRVLRGGSWIGIGRFARSAYRYAFLPGFRFEFIGFRLARGRSPAG